MPEIPAFRGLRYDLGHVGSLSDVIAPPYDVIGAELQDELYKKHPANVIRLILNRDEPATTSATIATPGRPVLKRLWHARACCSPRPIRRSTSITRSSPKAADDYTRRGFMGRVRLERFRRREHLSARRDAWRPQGRPPAC